MRMSRGLVRMTSMRSEQKLCIYFVSFYALSFQRGVTGHLPLTAHLAWWITPQRAVLGWT
jgi:hypothetical protein